MAVVYARVSPSRHAVYQAAAGKAGLSLAEWVRRTLDDAVVELPARCEWRLAPGSDRCVLPARHPGDHDPGFHAL